MDEYISNPINPDAWGKSWRRWRRPLTHIHQIYLPLTI